LQYWKIKESSFPRKKQYNPAMLNRPSKLRRKSNSPYFVIFTIIAFILGLAVGYLIWGENGGAVAGTDQIRRVTVSTDGDPSIGPEDAPVTIIEFSDYQCPYCAQWYQQVYQELMDSYPGQIKFVYRDNPIPSHPEAEPAAEAANCAGEQSAYWKFHDALFNGQYGLGRAAYEKYAADLRLNKTAFTECLDSHRFQDEVKADASDAAKAGINSTPSFVINGRLLIGALPIADFKTVIDEELAAANK
jgi:protein-disulfide isomerase